MNSDLQLTETATQQSGLESKFDRAMSQMEMSMLEAYSDSFSRVILNSTIARGKSIEEITLENNIPVSTTYRRVHYLCKKGLIIVERMIITGGGKKRAIFRSTFQGAKFEFQSGGIRVVGTPNEGIPDVAFRLWRFNNKDLNSAHAD